MKKSKDWINDIKINELRDFVSLYNEEAQYCLNRAQLRDIINESVIKCMIYDLYHCKSYEELELRIAYMNKLINNDLFNEVKKDLLIKLMKRKIELRQYLVLRHLVDFHSFSDFIEDLYQHNTSLDEIVKICLIEDQYIVAYQYLEMMDVIDESLLDLLYANSSFSYYQLMLNHKLKKHKENKYGKRNVLRVIHNYEL